MLSVDNTVHRQHTQAQSSYFLWSFFSYLSESQHLWPSGRLLLLEGGLNLPSFMTSWPRGALCTGRYIQGGPSCAEERKKERWNGWNMDGGEITQMESATTKIWLAVVGKKMRTQTLCVRWPMFRVGEILDFQTQLFSLFTVHFPLFLHEKNQTRTVTSRNKVLFLVSNLQLNNRNL